MYRNSRVLVVGTTPDYIEWIRRACPGRAFFLTDASVRQNVGEPAPPEEDELLCDLSDYRRASRALRRHLGKWGLHVFAVVCYDCEHMELASRLAIEYSLPYPSVEAIRNCRDKYASKVIWHESGLKCPRSVLVETEDDAVNFFHETGPCVAKPLTGAGSELVFRCGSAEEAAAAAAEIMRRLEALRDSPLYQRAGNAPNIVVEEYISGTEYSCDFIIARNQVEILRIARKLHSPDTRFGTIRGYVLENSVPEGIGEGEMKETFRRAALSLGIGRALCMVDFVVSGGDIVLLELAPRPGGDCLPPLIRHAMGMDTLSIALDFAETGHVTSEGVFDSATYAGLRVHAGKAGVLLGIDTGRLGDDPRVVEIDMRRRPGHLVTMPPEDYDSWLLGHVIFRAEEGRGVEEQLIELAGMLDISIAGQEDFRAAG